MDHSSFYLKRLPQGVRLRGSIWSAIASVFFLTGYASSLSNDHHAWQATATVRHPAGSNVAPKSARLSSKSTIQAEVSRPILVSAPAIAAESLAAQFAELASGLNYPLPVTANGPTRPASFPSFLPLQPSYNESAERRRAAYSSISVLSIGDGQTEIDPELDKRSLQTAQRVSPRSDLLDGVPEAYGALAVRIAVEEEVDPNWVLATMRAENAGFDRQLASPAGAIGLMQVMPQIGSAFGATDLTDPEQNIRAGTRFLRLLIDKYRNPVLIASAYNAGEPRVDANYSLPLIQETADYVTRVVGYYTGMPAALSAAQAATRPQAAASPAAHRGRAERAKSPMLVFSVADTSAALEPALRESSPIDAGGPVKIVKEEVIP